MLLGAEFRTGLIAGASAAVIGAFVGLVWRWRRSEPAPIVGLLVGGAAMATVLSAVGVSRRLALGLLVLAVAGAIHGRIRRGFLVAWLVAVPGAWLVTDATGLSLDPRLEWLGIALVAVSAPAVASADRYLGSVALGPALLGLSVVGIFFAIPDTEDALILLGVALPVALLGWPARLGSLGTTGAYVMVGVVTWTILRGGYGRPGSIAGAMACLGLLVVIPLAHTMAGASSRWPLPSVSLRDVILILTAHLGVVAVASRVVAVPGSFAMAAAMGVTLLLAAGLIWWWIEASLISTGRGE